MKSKNFASICTGIGKNSGQGFDALADPNRRGDGVITVSKTAQALPEMDGAGWVRAIHVDAARSTL